MGCEMKDYKRLTERDDSLCIDCADIGFCRKTCIRQARYERLQFLENEIESGKIDYVADSKTEQTITDLLIEFDEMGFAPTTVCPNAEQYAIDWREKVRKEFARLTEQEKQAVETLTRSFTRMETLYKVKCTEIEAKEEEISDLKAENAVLRERLEKAVELPYIEKCKEYTKIVYKNELGDIDDETYFHDCYYSYKNDIRGDKYAEARFAELKGEQK